MPCRTPTHLHVLKARLVGHIKRDTGDTVNRSKIQQISNALGCADAAGQLRFLDAGKRLENELEEIRAFSPLESAERDGALDIAKVVNDPNLMWCRGWTAEALAPCSVPTWRLTQPTAGLPSPNDSARRALVYCRRGCEVRSTRRVSPRCPIMAATDRTPLTSTSGSPTRTLGCLSPAT